MPSLVVNIKRAFTSRSVSLTPSYWHPCRSHQSVITADFVATEARMEAFERLPKTQKSFNLPGVIRPLLELRNGIIVT